MPHPFSFFLAKGWESAKLNVRNYTVSDLVTCRQILKLVAFRHGYEALCTIQNLFFERSVSNLSGDIAMDCVLNAR